MRKYFFRLVFVLAAVFVVVGVWGYLFEVKITPRKKIVSSPVLPTAQILAKEVTPEEGFTVDLVWGETGQKLVRAGGVDMAKYQKNYSGAGYGELLSYLTENKDQGITINEGNAYFWVNTLWALGLTQKSDVLEKGIMGTDYKKEIGNFASTAGWTLGAKDGVKLYSSADIIQLSPDQQAQVAKISEGVYRPCCGNPTSFPDCNHGMAILGLVELMVSQGFSEDEIYSAALAFNSYWFPQTYVDLAYYFETSENTSWEKVDSKRVLGQEFSSAQGYQAIKAKIGNIPGTQNVGGSCGA